MFKLRYGYLLSGIITGCILLVSFIATIPDGKLHIIFCAVGQGDAAYIKFPDGRDMLVDGGPDNTVLNCLGKHMPFWDRHINLVINSHPQNDHFFGLIEVLKRYQVDYLVKSQVDANTEAYDRFLSVIKTKNIPVKFMTVGQQIRVGPSTLSFLWPSQQQITKGTSVLESDSNDYCLVFDLRYGIFDVLFTGDA